MKHRSCISFATTLVLLSGAFIGASCGTSSTSSHLPASSSSHSHQIDTSSWSHDETYHWRTCSTCNERMDEGLHQFKKGGKNKICEICKYESEYSNEENFQLFKLAFDASLTYEGPYYTKVEERSNERNAIQNETYLGNGLYYYDNEEYEGDNERYSTRFSFAIKKEEDNYIFYSNDGYDNEGIYVTSGRMSKADEYTYQTLYRLTPKELNKSRLDYFIPMQGNTFEEYCSYLETAKNSLNRYVYYSKIKSIVPFVSRIDENMVHVGHITTIQSSQYNEETKENWLVKEEITITYEVSNGYVTSYSKNHNYHTTKEEDGTLISDKTNIYVQTIQYEGNGKLLDNFSYLGNSEDTPTEAYGLVTFYYGEHQIIDVYPTLIGRTLEDTFTYLYQALNINIFYSSYFEFYLDSALTIPYNNEVITSKGLKVYIQFTCPNNLAALIVQEEKLYQYSDDYPTFIEPYFRDIKIVSHLVIAKPGTYKISDYNQSRYSIAKINGEVRDLNDDAFETTANEITTLTLQSIYKR